MADFEITSRLGPAGPGSGAAARLSLTTLPAYQAGLDCVHCGLCLEACPTYRVTGLEPSSPRGRIHLMRSFAEGRIELVGESARHLDDCLGCRGCETVCPAGVRYAEMFEVVRDARRAERRTASGPARESGTRLRDRALDLLVRPRAARLLAATLALYGRSGLRAFARWSGLLDRLDPRLRMLESLVPDRAPRFWPGSNRLAVGHAPGSGSAPRPRVALFRGCVGEALFGQVNEQSGRLLALYGYDVIEVRDATCCGALDLHAGRAGRARALARRNLDAFAALGIGESGGADFIASTAAGCGAMLRDLSRHFDDAPGVRALATRVESRVRDVSELLIAGTPASPPRPLALTVTYDAPCHLIHAQRVAQAPLALIAAIPGLRMVPLAGSELCCGSAGIYNVLHPDMANRVLEQKIEAIRATGAGVVLTGNPGCQLHIAAGLRAARLDVDVMHPVSLLARAHGLT